MRLLNTIRSWPNKRSSAAEATTDDSQRSATAGNSSLKQAQRLLLLHRPRRDAAADTADASVKLQMRRRHWLSGQSLSGHQSGDGEYETLPNSGNGGGGGGGGSGSGGGVADDEDLFQTLMSNSAAAGGSSVIMSSNNRRGGSMKFYHTDDPDFLPTAYPLTRTDPRCHRPAKWGSLNLAASAALIEKPLKRFFSVMDKEPRFRLGPRVPGSGDEDGKSSMGDRSSASSSRSRSAIEACTPKYAYISQDGKLVEREVHNWPKRKEPKLMLRYKLSEPYASNYGVKSARRARSLGQRVVLPRHRWIYERPIFLVPRAIINDNKRRLMARHLLKDRFEACARYPLPMSVSLQESEQSKRYREYQSVKYIREAGELVAHIEKMKHKMLNSSFNTTPQSLM